MKQDATTSKRRQLQPLSMVRAFEAVGQLLSLRKAVDEPTVRHTGLKRNHDWPADGDLSSTLTGRNRRFYSG